LATAIIVDRIILDGQIMAGDIEAAPGRVNAPVRLAQSPPHAFAAPMA